MERETCNFQIEKYIEQLENRYIYFLLDGKNICRRKK